MNKLLKTVVNDWLKNVYLYTSNFDLEIKQKNSCVLSNCRDLLDPHSV